MPLPPALLLLSYDPVLADLVRETLKYPWKFVCGRPDRYLSYKIFTEPNVRLVLLDDEAIQEDDRVWLLTQLRKHFSGSPLLYVASTHSESTEKQARTNGAQYYALKPLSAEHFGPVLCSFLLSQEIKG
jgi:DNA-binding response OmpR family regulator